MNEHNDSKWHSIKVDKEVFSYLQQQAQPFIDTPNDVLRRLLLSHPSVPRKPPPAKEMPKSDKGVSGESGGISSQQFVEMILDRHFGGGFRKVGRYRYMFESDSQIVYFRNYNKEAEILWYRVNGTERGLLSSSRKDVWLCLTYPPDRTAFLIPFDTIEEQAVRVGWKRDELEINVNIDRSWWNQLNWDIESYRHEFE